MALNADVCATTKMAEGMSAIVVETLNTTYRVIDVQPTFPTERSGGQTVE